MFVFIMSGAACCHLGVALLSDTGQEIGWDWLSFICYLLFSLRASCLLSRPHCVGSWMLIETVLVSLSPLAIYETLLTIICCCSF